MQFRPEIKTIQQIMSYTYDTGGTAILFFISRAATWCDIRLRASATAFHVGCLALLSQQLNISILHRSMFRVWSISITSNCDFIMPRFNPSRYQFMTNATSFVRSGREGVPIAVNENNQVTFHRVGHSRVAWNRILFWYHFLNLRPGDEARSKYIIFICMWN